MQGTGLAQGRAGTTKMKFWAAEEENHEGEKAHGVHRTNNFNASVHGVMKLHRKLDSN